MQNCPNASEAYLQAVEPVPTAGASSAPSPSKKRHVDEVDPTTILPHSYEFGKARDADREHRFGPEEVDPTTILPHSDKIRERRAADREHRFALLLNEIKGLIIGEAVGETNRVYKRIGTTDTELFGTRLCTALLSLGYADANIDKDTILTIQVDPEP